MNVTVRQRQAAQTLGIVGREDEGDTDAAVVRDEIHLLDVECIQGIAPLRPPLGSRCTEVAGPPS
jgi:hypothetical protein